LLLFLYLILAQQVFSLQNSNFGKIKFNYLTSTNGLTNNYVTDVLEDNRGFLWFSTSDGLNKWDGYKMQTFRFDPNNKNSLSNNFILTIAEDNSNNLWIGTNQKGVVRYNYHEEKFYRYVSDLNNPSSIQSTYIRDIFVDKKGTVWIGSDLGLCKYDSDTDLFKRIKFNPDSNIELINRIYSVTDSSVLFQTNQGLFTFHLDKNAFSPFVIDIEIPDLYTAPLCFTKSNELWIGSSMGLFRYDLANKKHQLYTQQNIDEITSCNFSWIYEDADENIWIGSENSGISIYQPPIDKFYKYESGILDGNFLSDNIITSVYEDSHANLWIATKEGGLSYFNKGDNIFQYYEYLPNHPIELMNPKVSSFVEDTEKNIWIGTGGGGLHKIDASTNRIKQYQFENESIAPNILDMIEFDDYLYLTGWGTGLVKFNKKTGIFREVSGQANTYPTKAPLNIKGMGLDIDGNIWLAVHNKEGLYVYSTSNNQFYNSLNPGEFNQQLLNAPYSVDIMQDSKNRIWVASYSSLYMYDGEYHEFKTNIDDSSSISSNYIYDICEGSDSSIWIGSTMGLDRLIESPKGFHFERVSKKFSLPQNVKGIEASNNENIWISSNTGLTQFNYQTKEKHHYFLNKNIQGQEFNERALFKSSKGEIFLGSNYGFYRFSPDSINVANDNPKIYITDFKIFNESQKPNNENSPLTASILDTHEISLSHNQSALSFNYVAINFNNLVNIDYAFKLEGFEENWNYVGNQLFANYTNLEPGEYTFRVKAITGNQMNEEPEAFLKITIEPPFWATTFAYILYIILSLLIIFIIQWTIINRINLKNELRLEKLRIHNANETNLMKLRFFTNISHEFRTPLTLIQAPIEKLLNKDAAIDDEERNYHYKMIKNATSKMLRMVNQLMDYRKFEAGSLVLEPSQGDFIGFCKKT
ncbi:MAG: triple tyrosine motif-containing protein, partial [Prolixibacteraceae bacterium]|nr:triple tyrosine motif-containing protein [Prolixibacteraceae bacterium]